MIFKVAICDDEEKDILTIRDFLRSYEMEYDVDFEINTFLNGTSLLNQYQQPGTYHILFLDVEMPQMNGLELATQIRNLGNKNVAIVFVSNYPEYMQDSFNVQAYQYLPKPLNYEVFKKLMKRIQKDYEESHITKLLVSEDGKEELIYADDILVIKTLDGKRKQLEFILTKKTIEAKGAITEWEDSLSELFFISPCRGYLVNLNHVHYLEEEFLIMDNEMKIPLSRRKEKEIRNLFTKRLLRINNHRGI